MDYKKIAEDLGVPYTDRLILKDKRGAARVFNLFLENDHSQKNHKNYYPPIYTVGNDDRLDKGCLSLKKIYLSLNDPTEYLISQIAFLNYDHWLRLVNSGWFVPYLNAWREELAVKMQQECLATIAKHAKSGSKDSVQASKYIAEQAWKKHQRGRPSKAEVNRHLKLESDAQKAITNDAERIGLKLVKKDK